jgi:hypothetical protein
MADFEGILARHSQSPYPHGQTFFYIFMEGSDGSATLGLCFSDFKKAKKEINFIYFM